MFPFVISNVVIVVAGVDQPLAPTGLGWFMGVFVLLKLERGRRGFLKLPSFVPLQAKFYGTNGFITLLVVVGRLCFH